MASRSVTYDIKPSGIDLSGFTKLNSAIKETISLAKDMTSGVDSSMKDMVNTSNKTATSVSKASQSMAKTNKSAYSEVSTEAKTAASAVKSSGSKMSSAFSKVSSSASSAKTSIGKSLTAIATKAKAATKLVAFALGGLAVAGVAYTTNLAADAAEVQNKFDVAFAGITDSAESWIDSYASSVGRSRNETKKLLADTQDLLTGFGATTDEAFTMSTEIQSLGVDLASFNNLQDDAAVEALRKGLMGETENLKALGIIINDTNSAQEAAAEGYTTAWSDLDQLTKMQIRYNLAVQQSKNAVGDAQRSMSSFVNQSKALKSNITDIATEIGGYFLPAATGLITIINSGFSKAYSFITNRFTPAVSNVGFAFSVLVRLAHYMADQVLEAFDIPSLPLGDIIISVMNNVVNGIATFTTFLFNNKDQIISTFKSIGSSASDTFGNISKSVLPQLMPVISSITDYFIPSLIEGVQSLMGTFKDNFPAMKETVKMAFNFLTKTVLPPFLYIMESIYKDVMPPVVDAITSIANDTLPLIISAVQAVMAVLRPIVAEVLAVLSFMWPYVTNGFTFILTTIKEVFSGVSLTLQGVLDFITGVFTGDWKKAWTGIKEFVVGLFSTFEAVMKIPINAVIALINGAIDNINKIGIDVPDWVPGIGGNSLTFDVPKIDYLAKGTSYFGGGSAIVGEKGPELVNLPTGSSVTNNSDTMDLLNGLYMSAKSLSQYVKTPSDSSQTATGTNASGMFNINVNVSVAAGASDKATSTQIASSLKAPVKKVVENIFRELTSEMGLS